MPANPTSALATLVVASAWLTACGPDTSPSPSTVPTCAPEAVAATGDLSADMVGRWQRVQHYTDQRFYEFADDGTVTVWHLDLGEEAWSERTTWNIVGDVVGVDESPATRLEMSLAPSPIGDVWRAPAEYVFRRCSN